ncbi:MAG: phosphoribosylglycinamide formyltransferase [Actinomycetaceae bacterium]|nr:phosphoribosylglycinamide formyltransferase [Actinomycetaceae bacterium]
MSSFSTDGEQWASRHEHWSLPQPAKVAVLISGQGSNMQALVEQAPNIGIEVVLVVADRPHTAGLAWAEDQGLSTAVVAVSDFATRSQWDEYLANVLCESGADLVVSAGFLKLLGGRVLAAFPGRIINTHNSLLPSFTGTDGPAQALAAGVKLAGATVFLVDAGMDTGSILSQTAVPVLPADDEDSLLDRIKVAERKQLVDTVAKMVSCGWYTRGRVAHLACE